MEHIRSTTRLLPDDLLAEGRPTITSAEASARLGLPADQTLVAMARLVAQGRLFSPSKGLYVVVPSEYRSWGVVPADWFVDDMMRHLGRTYYVGLLSAAAFHGASHHAAQVFQVMVDRQVADRDLRRVRLRFFVHRLVDRVACEQRTVATGTIRVSAPETTALDLVAFESQAGGLSNVAAVLGDLALDGERLATLASLYPRSIARRVGWLCEELDVQLDLEPLRAVARPETGEATKLVARASKRGSLDPRWGVRVNERVELEP